MDWKFSHSFAQTAWEVRSDYGYPSLSCINSMAEATYEDCVKHSEKLKAILGEIPSPLIASNRGIDCLYISSVYYCLAKMLHDRDANLFVLQCVFLHCSYVYRFNPLISKVSTIALSAFIDHTWHAAILMLNLHNPPQFRWNVLRTSSRPNAFYSHGRISDHGRFASLLSDDHFINHTPGLANSGSWQLHWPFQST